MKGELKNDIDGVCSSNISGTWFFSECPSKLSPFTSTDLTID